MVLSQKINMGIQASDPSAPDSNRSIHGPSYNILFLETPVFFSKNFGSVEKRRPCYFSRIISLEFDVKRSKEQNGIYERKQLVLPVKTTG